VFSSKCSRTKYTVTIDDATVLIKDIKIQGLYDVTVPVLIKDIEIQGLSSFQGNNKIPGFFITVMSMIQSAKNC